MNLLFFLLLTAVHCRHRPDIFKDHLTITQAIHQARLVYAFDSVPTKEPESVDLQSILKGAVKTVASGVGALGEFGKLAVCTKTSIGPDSKIGEIRAKCASEFEAFAKEFTTTLVKAETVGKSKEEREWYEGMIRVQERIVEYLPFMPPMRPMSFIVSLTMFLLVLIVPLLAFIVRCCCCGREEPRSLA